jgi:hypothetical protein
MFNRYQLSLWQFFFPNLKKYILFFNISSKHLTLLFKLYINANSYLLSYQKMQAQHHSKCPGSCNLNSVLHTARNLLLIEWHFRSFSKKHNNAYSNKTHHSAKCFFCINEKKRQLNGEVLQISILMQTGDWPKNQTRENPDLRKFYKLKEKITPRNHPFPRTWLKSQHVDKFEANTDIINGVINT